MVFNHQNKGRAFICALIQAGYTVTNRHEKADFVLSDTDVLGKQPHLDCCHAYGAPAFLYPHCARPPIFWDGIFEAWPHTRAHFVVTDAHGEVMKRYGYPHPVHAVGWSLCPIRTFRPVSNPRRVLFAPIHCNANGWLSDLDQEINRESYRRLLRLVRTGDIELMVRYLYSLESCGLWKEDGVAYTKGQPNSSYEDILQADVVVSHETFAFMAVALGVPTVMLAEWEAPRIGGSPKTFKRAARWDDYKDLVMYPFSILAGDDALAILRQAARSDAEITDWRRRMIGEPFDAQTFVATVEGYLQ